MFPQSTKKKYFRLYNKSSGVNLDDAADLTKDFVEVENLNENSITPINGKSLNAIYVTVMNNKIEDQEIENLVDYIDNFMSKKNAGHINITVNTKGGINPYSSI